MSLRDEIQRHLSFSPVNKSTVGLLKIIHRELLPVHYSDDIYEMMQDPKAAHSELAFLYDDTAVGEVAFRIEAHEGGSRAYLMTIGVLKTYQRYGIGTLLLQHAIDEAKKLSPISELYLHVQAINEGAIEFYRRHNFVQGELVAGFYKSLENGDAYVFSLPIEHAE